jgi:hypothetical protein
LVEKAEREAVEEKQKIFTNALAVESLADAMKSDKRSRG